MRHQAIRASEKGGGALAILTESQKACLHRVGEGKSSKEIARELGLTPGTVDQYVNRASSALGAKNRRDAARKLKALENSELKHFKLRSEEVVKAAKLGSLKPSSFEDSSSKWVINLVRWMPPLGGNRDDLTFLQTTLEIGKAALIAGFTFVSIVASGTWLQSLVQ